MFCQKVGGVTVVVDWAISKQDRRYVVTPPPFLFFCRFETKTSRIMLAPGSLFEMSLFQIFLSDGIISTTEFTQLIHFVW